MKWWQERGAQGVVAGPAASGELAAPVPAADPELRMPVVAGAGAERDGHVS